MKIHRTLYYLLLFFLPTQLGLHLWPSWSYVLGRRIDYLSPTVFITDILLVFMIVCWAIEQRTILLWRRPALRAFLAAVFLITLIAINIVQAHNAMAAAYKWLKVLEFSLFFYYIKTTKPSFTTSSLVLLLAMTYSSLLAVAQFFYHHSIGGIFWYLGERTFTGDTPGIARFDWCGPLVSVCRPVLRPYATFPHPNVLAGYIAVLLAPVIFMVQKTNRFLFTAMIAVSIFTLILTFSRSGLTIGFVVAVLVLVLRIPKTRTTKTVLVALIACIAGALTLTVKQLSVSSQSVLLRRELNTGAITLWKSSPLFGIGLGNMIVGTPSVMQEKQVYFLQPTHNIYLLILAETGVAGAWIFLWILINTCLHLRDQYTQKKRAVVLVKTLSLAGILLVGFVDHYPLTLQQGQLLLVYIVGMSYIES